MNRSRIFLLIMLVLITFLITNLPDFHLDEHVDMRNSPMKDVLLHGAYYFATSLIVFLLFRNSKLPVAVVCLILFLPALFEFSQGLIRGRTVSAYDMLGNYFGIAAAFGICFITVALVREVKKKPKFKS